MQVRLVLAGLAGLALWPLLAAACGSDESAPAPTHESGGIDVPAPVRLRYTESATPESRNAGSSRLRLGHALHVPRTRWAFYP